MINHNVFNPSLPNTTNVDWSNLQGSSKALALSYAYKKSNNPLLVIVNNISEGIKLEKSILFFLNKKDEKNILFFPDHETLPYDQITPHQDIISDRIKLLYSLNKREKYLLIISIHTLLNVLPPKEYINKNTFILNKNETIDIQKFTLNLEKLGYYHVSQVLSHGEYSIRGGIIDIFPMGSKKPFRIELFDNDIESMREFDVESQISDKIIDNIEILPAKEYPLTDDSIKLFKEQWHETFDFNPKKCSFYQSIIKKIATAGTEYYIPLFFKNTETLLDYLPDNIEYVQVGNIFESAKQYFKEATDRFDQINFDKHRAILHPSKLFLTPDYLFSTLKKKKNILIKDKSKHCDFKCSKLPNLTFDIRKKEPLERFKSYISNSSTKILIVAESLGRNEIISSLLNNENISFETSKNWDAFLESKSKLSITIGFIDEGFHIEDQNIAIITENDLFGYQNTPGVNRSKSKSEPKDAIKNLIELEEDSPVVHTKYGIGLYKGLIRLNANETSEYICLSYLDNDLIYVPVTSLHLINRYSGIDKEKVQLTKLGNNQWSKEKVKAIEQIKDIAAELLELYAHRKEQTGFTFNIDQSKYFLFCSKFQYNETYDQTNAIKNVLSDMASKLPMDRLICGDVGFGKTEVAMRAAFIAVTNKKQVAILVPTTLLASQHTQTFIDRFSGLNIKIETLSRFKTASQNKQIKEDLKNGKIDIIIGTHTLLQKNIKFFDLGLLVIDEEHRFGVKQKEFITALRSKIDILTLTATPIPRTLNMSLNGIRDISIIATPPEKRLSIKTFIHEKNKSILREAIMREFLRGGQVYFLYNEIQSIENMYEELSILVPEAKIRIAHGQIPKKNLEQIMKDFYHSKFNLLLCTTIIENGLDLPTANTIIVNRADKFGLAQLHQLRGRVGRSHHQAYAYLIIPGKKLITKDALKRLEALSTLTDLGAGFSLATHDLEIRGTGDILGEKQSGSIQKIGFSLFSELLDKTIKAMKANVGKIELTLSNYRCEINLNAPAIIPEDYMPSVKSRLVMYKRIADADSEEKLYSLQIEMIDRFGLLPEYLKNYFLISKYQLEAEKLGISKIELNSMGGYMILVDKPNINPDSIIDLIKENPKEYQLKGPNKIMFNKILKENQSRFEYIEKLLETLEPSDTIYNL